MLFPKKSEWKSWRPTTRIAYLAQAATAFSLVVTVAFSALAWHEAHQARVDQQRFFIEEKSPDLEVTSINFQALSGTTERLVQLNLKNTGSSTASNVIARLYDNSSMTLLRSTEGKLSELLRIARGKEFAFPILRDVALSKSLGFVPTDIRLLTSQSSLKPNENVSLFLELSYQGPLGDDHSSLVYIVTTMPTKPPMEPPSATGTSPGPAAPQL